MKHTIITLSFLALMVASCNTPSNQNNAETTEQHEEEAMGINALREFESTDTVKVGNTVYTYKYSFYNVDSLHTIKTYDGLEYKDNAVTLTIYKGDTETANRTFTKNSFLSYIPEDKHTNAGLVGFSYDYTMRDDHSAIFFIVTLGDPDETSDLSYPLRLKMDANGNIISVEQVTNLETEPINEGLTVDPEIDAG